MSDYGDFCREQRAHKREVRRKQSKDNFRFMDEMVALGFVYTPVGGGWRFSHESVKLRLDFWPSSGKWTEVGTNVYDCGPRKMVNHAKAFVTKHGQLETANQPTPKAPRKWKPTGPGNPPWET